MKESLAEDGICRVAVIEDQTLFRQLTVEIVAANPRFAVVGEAASGREGWALCLDTRPDLVILDLAIPELDGFTLCRQIRQELPETKVIVVTSHTDAITVTRLSELGITGYVEKDQPLDTLRQALTTVAEGGRFYTRLVGETRRQLQGDPHAFSKVLSAREQETLALIAAGLKNREIAERLQISVRTVEGHRASIMEKLNIRNLAGLIDFVRKQDLGGRD